MSVEATADLIDGRTSTIWMKMREAIMIYVAHEPLTPERRLKAKTLLTEVAIMVEEVFFPSNQFTEGFLFEQ